MNILTLISFTIYILYNIITLWKVKKIPNNLSNTYYVWPKWVFPLVILLMVWPMMPSWLALTTGTSWQFLPLLTCASATLAALSPDYLHSDIENRLHSSCVIAVISMIILLFLAGKFIMFLDILIKLLLIGFLFNKKGFKQTWVYWLETSLFLATYISFI